MDALRAWKSTVGGGLVLCALTLPSTGCVMLPTGRPPGSAQVINNRDLVGTWQDENGGSTTFRDAGDFTADRTCGQRRVRTGS